MVTFSTRDSHEELNRKFKIKPKDDNIIISDEQYDPNYQKDNYVCDVCQTTLQYNDIDKSYWCNTCVRYIEPQAAKKVVDFEIPQSAQDVEPAAYSIDSPGFEDVSVKKKVEVKGGLKALSQKGTIRITDYNEGVG